MPHNCIRRCTAGAVSVRPPVLASRTGPVQLLKAGLRIRCARFPQRCDMGKRTPVDLMKPAAPVGVACCRLPGFRPLMSMRKVGAIPRSAMKPAMGPRRTLRPSPTIPLQLSCRPLGSPFGEGKLMHAGSRPSTPERGSGGMERGELLLIDVAFAMPGFPARMPGRAAGPGSRPTPADGRNMFTPLPGGIRPAMPSTARRMKSCPPGCGRLPFARFVPDILPCPEARPPRPAAREVALMEPRKFAFRRFPGFALFIGLGIHSGAGGDAGAGRFPVRLPECNRLNGPTRDSGCFRRNGSCPPGDCLTAACRNSDRPQARMTTSLKQFNPVRFIGTGHRFRTNRGRKGACRFGCLG